MISEFALFVFTTLGGLGAGFYAAAAIFPPEGRKKNILVTAIPLVLLCIGGVALLMHLGHPERFLNAFANPAAGIAQEGITVGLFGLVLAIDLICTLAKGATPRALRIVGCVVGVALCIVMGLAYYGYERVAAWHSLITIALFLFGSLAAGIALFSVVDGDAAQKRGFSAMCIASIALAVIAFVAECAIFGGTGMGAAPFAAAAVLAVVGLACILYKRSADVSWRYGAVFAVVFVAVVVARYAFYTAI